MLDKLRHAQEIAVDLEYHSYRSFGGFVCLMQISSREEDWIVDPFELRDEMEELNEVFTDSKIVKVRQPPFSCPHIAHSPSIFRYSMGPRATSPGCSKTSIFMLSTSSIHIMHPKSSTSRDMASPHSSRCTATSRRTSVIN